MVILEGDNLAVIERRRDGRVYFVLPGGGVEVGELLEAAAIREAFEELDVRVSLLGLVAQVTFVVDGIASRQHYFAAQITGGVFGTGPGPEYSRADPSRGTYRATWISLEHASQSDVHPRPVVLALLGRGLESLLDDPLDVEEPGEDTIA